MFMGQEFAQFREWDFENSLEWFMIDQFENHKNYHEFIKELNKFYLKNPPLWQNDDSWEGFQWISHDDYKQSIISFRRIDDEKNEIITVCNFVPVTRNEYRIGVPEKGTYYEVFNSASEKYGGEGITNISVKAEPIPMHGYDYSIEIKIPSLSVMFFKKRKLLQEIKQPRKI